MSLSLCTCAVVCDSGCGKGACVCNNTCYCAEGYTGLRCSEKGECSYKQCFNVFQVLTWPYGNCLHDIMQFLLSQQSLMPSVKKYDKNEALAEFFLYSLRPVTQQVMELT